MEFWESVDWFEGLLERRPEFSRRKVTDEDVVMEDMAEVAEAYARGYAGDLNFANEMAELVLKGSRLSIPQARGTMNVLRAQVLDERSRGQLDLPWGDL